MAQVEVSEPTVAAAPPTPPIALALRALADFYEAHPSMPPPYNGLSIYALSTKGEAAALARAFGTCEKEFTSSGLLIISKDFGGLTLNAYFSREQVCERVVIGTKMIEAKPERIVPAEPEREEDIVEWRCAPILGAEEGR